MRGAGHVHKVRHSIMEAVEICSSPVRHAKSSEITSVENCDTYLRNVTGSLPTLAIDTDNDGMLPNSASSLSFSFSRRVGVAAGDRITHSWSAEYVVNVHSNEIRKKN